MALPLQNHEMRGLMSIAQHIEAVEASYRKFGHGRGANIPQHILWIERAFEDAVKGRCLKVGSKGSLKFKEALLPSLGSAGLQAYTACLPAGLETYMIFFDASSGVLAAIIEVLYYDWIETAAVAAVATKHLASEDCAFIALFDTGRQARPQPYALCEVRSVQRIQAYSCDRAKREAFCERMSRELKIEPVSANTPGEALQDASVVTIITPSASPVFDSRALAERPIHINAMGACYPRVREVDNHVVLRSRITLDDYDSMTTSRTCSNNRRF